MSTGREKFLYFRVNKAFCQEFSCLSNLEIAEISARGYISVSQNLDLE